MRPVQLSFCSLYTKDVKWSLATEQRSLEGPCKWHFCDGIVAVELVRNHLLPFPPDNSIINFHLFHKRRHRASCLSEVLNGTRIMRLRGASHLEIGMTADSGRHGSPWRTTGVFPKATVSG